MRLVKQGETKYSHIGRAALICRVFHGKPTGKKRHVKWLNGVKTDDRECNPEWSERPRPKPPAKWVMAHVVNIDFAYFKTAEAAAEDARSRGFPDATAACIKAAIAENNPHTVLFARRGWCETKLTAKIEALAGIVSPPDLPQETWRAFNRNNSLYISDRGRIKNWNKSRFTLVHHHKGARTLALGALREYRYKYNKLHFNPNTGNHDIKECTRPTVASLVLEMFVGEQPPGTRIQHHNDDKLDDRLENLAYVKRGAAAAAAAAAPHTL